MKSKTSLRLATELSLATLLLCILCAPAAIAQDREQKLAEFLERYPESDLNQDGMLTREEVHQFNQKRRSKPERSRKRERPEPTAADFAYGEHEKQRFDIWAVPDAKTPTPLVIFIHGGGFRGGDKVAFNPRTIEQYHKAGLAFASMNYRLSDAGPYPIMMQDCARGLQTIRHHAKKWKIDPKRIGCYGSSAGAGISLWLAFHDDLAEPESEDPIARQSTRIMAAATSNGQSTYDLRTYREWFGLPSLKAHEAMYPLYGVKQESDWESKRVQELMADASPITHLTADDEVPVYMSYSRPNSKVDATTDQSVWVHHYRLGEKLQQAMQKLDLECHLIDRTQRRGDLKYQGTADFFIDKLSP